MRHLALLLIVHISLMKCQDLILVKSDEGQGESDSNVETAEVSTGEVFVPTDEWQEIINGQAIPAGLHVRVNLETGKKEAKLMMEEEPIGEVHGIKHEALKEVLKNIKSDFKIGKEGEFDPAKFRSMNELKSELGDVN